MKAKLLLLLIVLAVAGFAGYEIWQGRDPLAPLVAIYRGPTAATAPAPTSAPATAPLAADSIDPTRKPLILSAPPRESIEDGDRRFGPMAEYLARVLQRPVVYKHPGTWGGYQTDLQRDAYDLVFDGPHFVGWRIERFNHGALVKLPGEFLYLGFVRRDNERIRDIQQLAGQTVCVHAPPNLGTLMLLSEFDNPSRQPSVVITEGYANIYKGVIEGKCVAGMLPTKHLAKHDKDGKTTRIFYRHRPAPQQALTAGPQVSESERIRIVAALTSPEAESALSAFREAYALSGWFIPATSSEYASLGNYLKPVQGFYTASK